MQRITIRDIAKLADVSVTTVFRALNAHAGIRRETKERILHIWEKTGYHVNLLAKSRSSTIGLILPDISSPFHAALSLYIETCAREQGYQVMQSFSFELIPSL